MRRRGVPVLAAGLLAGVLLSGCDLVPGLGDPPPPPGEADAFALAIGDCLDDADVATEVTSVPRVECADPHDSEVFARTESASTSYPGAPALEQELTAFCRGDVFTGFVGIPFEQSRYRTSGYFPTEASWATGDRELLCTIWDPQGRVSGSLEGTAE